jgi:hypothetical protein
VITLPGVGVAGEDGDGEDDGDDSDLDPAA